MKEEKSGIDIYLLCSLIIAAVYLIYSVWYWFASSAAEELESGMTLLVLPHLAAVLLALIINVLGLFIRKSALALAAGILYTVSLLLFPLYFFFVIAEAVLCYISFAKMRKHK